MSKLALVRRPSPRLADGLLTHMERVPVDVELAMRQWEGYVAALQSCGWQTVEVAPAPDCPDSVFIEDASAGERPGAMRRAEGLVQMGTTAAYSLTAAGHRITIVGDVPADTVRSIAAAIQPE